MIPYSLYFTVLFLWKLMHIDYLRSQKLWMSRKYISLHIPVSRGDCCTRVLVIITLCTHSPSKGIFSFGCACVCVCVHNWPEKFLCCITQVHSVFRQFSPCHFFNCLLLPNTFSDFQNIWVLLCIDTDSRKKHHLLTDGTVRILLLWGWFESPLAQGEANCGPWRGIGCRCLWVTFVYNLDINLLKPSSYFTYHKV